MDAETQAGETPSDALSKRLKKHTIGQLKKGLTKLKELAKEHPTAAKRIKIAVILIAVAALITGLIVAMPTLEQAFKFLENVFLPEDTAWLRGYLVLFLALPYNRLVAQ